MANNGSFTILSQDLVITKKSESWVIIEDNTYNIAYTVVNKGSGDTGASTIITGRESHSHTRTVYD